MSDSHNMMKAMIETPEHDLIFKWGGADFEEPDENSIDICFEPGQGIMQFSEGLINVSTLDYTMPDMDELKTIVQTFLGKSNVLQGGHLQLALIDCLTEYGYFAEARLLIEQIKKNLEV